MRVCAVICEYNPFTSAMPIICAPPARRRRGLRSLPDERRVTQRGVRPT
ncbi:MAG: hypothetical protein ACLUI3_01160 [Christensenellales bacterium]